MAVMEALLKIKADVTGTGAVDKLGKSLGGVQQSAGKLTGGLGGLATTAGAVTSALAGLAAGGALAGVMKTFGDYQADILTLERGLKNLGGTASSQLEPLKKLASDLGEQTLFNEEDFNKGFGLLTSFGNIGVKQYGRVAMAASDVAQVSGTDVQSAMMQLAKALNAPSQGVAALARSGIQFTDAQKAMIKSMEEAGNLAGAQELIFAELEKQYGGASVAAASGFAGAMDTMGEKFYDVQKAIGPLLEAGLKPLIAVLTTVADVLGNVVIPVFTSLPEPLQAVVGIVTVLGVALAALVPVLGVITPGLMQMVTLLGGLKLGAVIAGWAGAIGPAMAAISAAFTAFLAFLSGTVLPALVAFFSGPVGWTVLAVAAVVAMAIAFREPIEQFLSWIGSVFMEGIKALWNWTEPARQAILGLFEWYVGYVKTSFQVAWAIVDTVFIQPWVTLWNVLLRKPVTKALDWLSGIWGGVSKAFNDYVVAPIQKGWNALVELLPNAMKKAADFVKGVWTGMINAVKSVIRSYLQSIANMVNGVAGLVNRLISAFNRLPGADIPLIPQLTVPAFANGGVVRRPTLAMVGEGGQQEYIIPESKMAAASASYLAGARGASVLNGGGSAPTINITTGPVVEFDGKRYVSMEDMQRAMRQTAEGMIGRLRTPSARIALGGA